MRFDRHKLEAFVKTLYPYHKVKDGAKFAFQRGQLTETAYNVVMGIEDENAYDDYEERERHAK